MTAQPEHEIISPSMTYHGTLLNQFLFRTHHCSSFHNNKLNNNNHSSLSSSLSSKSTVNEWKLQFFAFLDSEYKHLSSLQQQQSSSCHHHSITMNSEESSLESASLYYDCFLEELKEQYHQMKSIVTHQWLPSSHTTGTTTSTTATATDEYDPDNEYDIHRRTLLAIWRFDQLSSSTTTTNTAATTTTTMKQQEQNQIMKNHEHVIESLLNAFDSQLTSKDHSLLMHLYYGRALIKKQVGCCSNHHINNNNNINNNSEEAEEEFFYSYLYSQEVQSLYKSLRHIRSDYEREVFLGRVSSDVPSLDEDIDDDEESSDDSQEAQVESDDEPMAHFDDRYRNENNKRRRGFNSGGDDMDELYNHDGQDDEMMSMMTIENESSSSLDSVEHWQSRRRQQRSSAPALNKKRRMEKPKFSQLSPDAEHGLGVLIETLRRLSEQNLDLFVCR